MTCNFKEDTKFLCLVKTMATQKNLMPSKLKGYTKILLSFNFKVTTKKSKLLNSLASFTQIMLRNFLAFYGFL